LDYNGFAFPFTHDTGLLCKQCAENFDTEFKEHYDVCVRMVKFATDSRYEEAGEESFNETDATYAINGMNAVVGFIADKLSGDIDMSRYAPAAIVDSIKTFQGQQKRQNDR
jgi:HEPN domain-containing protein